MFGDRFTGLGQVIDWIEGFDAVCVTVEYRLAPEHPDPYPVEDSYAGLRWTFEKAADLGIDPHRLVIVGTSAGGGVAAGTVLLARDRLGRDDRKAPSLAGQMLLYPMLDDRDDTVSARQFDGSGVWSRASNATAWTALLGDRRGTGNVSIYAAPARASDLSGLPPTFVACGSADLFRDEDIAYASAIWAAGGEAELHVWPGAYHLWDTIAPYAELTARFNEARTHWFVRVLQR
jgi:acetyl esterase/lipase